MLNILAQSRPNLCHIVLKTPNKQKLPRHISEDSYSEHSRVEVKVVSLNQLIQSIKVKQGKPLLTQLPKLTNNAHGIRNRHTFAQYQEYEER